MVTDYRPSRQRVASFHQSASKRNGNQMYKRGARLLNKGDVPRYLTEGYKGQANPLSLEGYGRLINDFDSLTKSVLSIIVDVNRGNREELAKVKDVLRIIDQEESSMENLYSGLQEVAHITQDLGITTLPSALFDIAEVISKMCINPGLVVDDGVEDNHEFQITSFNALFPTCNPFRKKLDDAFNFDRVDFSSLNLPIYAVENCKASLVKLFEGIHAFIKHFKTGPIDKACVEIQRKYTLVQADLSKVTAQLQKVVNELAETRSRLRIAERNSSSIVQRRVSTSRQGSMLGISTPDEDVAPSREATLDPLKVTHNERPQKAPQRDKKESHDALSRREHAPRLRGSDPNDDSDGSELSLEGTDAIAPSLPRQQHKPVSRQRIVEDQPAPPVDSFQMDQPRPESVKNMLNYMFNNKTGGDSMPGVKRKWNTLKQERKRRLPSRGSRTDGRRPTPSQETRGVTEADVLLMLLSSSQENQAQPVTPPPPVIKEHQATNTDAVEEVKTTKPSPAVLALKRVETTRMAASPRSAIHSQGKFSPREIQRERGVIPAPEEVVTFGRLPFSVSQSLAGPALSVKNYDKPCIYQLGETRTFELKQVVKMLDERCINQKKVVPLYISMRLARFRKKALHDPRAFIKVLDSIDAVVEKQFRDGYCTVQRRDDVIVLGQSTDDMQKALKTAFACLEEVRGLFQNPAELKVAISTNRSTAVDLSLLANPQEVLVETCVINDDAKQKYKVEEMKLPFGKQEADVTSFTRWNAQPRVRRLIHVKEDFRGVVEKEHETLAERLETMQREDIQEQSCEKNQCAVIIIVDILGSSDAWCCAASVEPDDTEGKKHAEEFYECMTNYRALIRQALITSCGWEVWCGGDAFVLGFGKLKQALQWTASVMESPLRWPMQFFNKTPDMCDVVRVGISLGDVKLKEDKLVGVNLFAAAALCSLAGGGDILLSQMLGIQARAFGHPTRDIGLRRVPELDTDIFVVALSAKKIERTTTEKKKGRAAVTMDPRVSSELLRMHKRVRIFCKLCERLNTKNENEMPLSDDQFNSIWAKIINLNGPPETMLVSELSNTLPQVRTKDVGKNRATIDEAARFVIDDDLKEERVFNEAQIQMISKSLLGFLSRAVRLMAKAKRSVQYHKQGGKLVAAISAFKMNGGPSTSAITRSILMAPQTRDPAVVVETAINKALTSAASKWSNLKSNVKVASLFSNLTGKTNPFLATLGAVRNAKMGAADAAAPSSSLKEPQSKVKLMLNRLKATNTEAATTNGSGGNDAAAANASPRVTINEPTKAKPSDQNLQMGQQNLMQDNPTPTERALQPSASLFKSALQQPRELQKFKGHQQLQQDDGQQQRFQNEQQVTNQEQQQSHQVTDLFRQKSENMYSSGSADQHQHQHQHQQHPSQELQRQLQHQLEYQQQQHQHQHEQHQLYQEQHQDQPQRQLEYQHQHHHQHKHQHHQQALLQQQPFPQHQHQHQQALGKQQPFSQDQHHQHHYQHQHQHQHQHHQHHQQALVQQQPFPQHQHQHQHQHQQALGKQQPFSQDQHQQHHYQHQHQHQHHQHHQQALGKQQPFPQHQHQHQHYQHQQALGKQQSFPQHQHQHQQALVQQQPFSQHQHDRQLLFQPERSPSKRILSPQDRMKAAALGTKKADKLFQQIQSSVNQLQGAGTGMTKLKSFQASFPAAAQPSLVPPTNFNYQGSPSLQGEGRDNKGQAVQVNAHAMLGNPHAQMQNTHDRVSKWQGGDQLLPPLEVGGHPAKDGKVPPPSGFGTGPAQEKKKIAKVMTAMKTSMIGLGLRGFNGQGTETSERGTPAMRATPVLKKDHGQRGGNQMDHLSVLRRNVRGKLASAKMNRFNNVLKEVKHASNQNLHISLPPL